MKTKEQIVERLLLKESQTPEDDWEAGDINGWVEALQWVLKGDAGAVD